MIHQYFKQFSQVQSSQHTNQRNTNKAHFVFFYDNHTRGQSAIKPYNPCAIYLHTKIILIKWNKIWCFIVGLKLCPRPSGWPAGYAVTSTQHTCVFVLQHWPSSCPRTKLFSMFFVLSYRHISMSYEVGWLVGYPCCGLHKNHVESSRLVNSIINR